MTHNYTITCTECGDLLCTNTKGMVDVARATKFFESNGWNVLYMTQCDYSGFRLRGLCSSCQNDILVRELMV